MMTASLPSILGIVFIVLKLTGVINWHWVWVLAPFWVGLVVVVPLALLIFALIKIVDR